MADKFVPGDIVWVVERDGDGDAIGHCGLVYMAECNGAVIASVVPNGNTDIDDVVSYQITSTAEDHFAMVRIFPAEDCYASVDAVKSALDKEAEHHG